MKNQIKPQIKKIRANKLVKIAKKARTKFLIKNIGSNYPTLFESKDKNGNYLGYTPNYIRVKKSSSSKLTNIIKAVKIKKNNIIY